MEYYVKKKEYVKDDINFIEIFFENGDYLTIFGKEVADISVRLYDDLVLGNNYWNSFCATSEKYDNFNRLLKECSAKNRENQQIKN